MGFVYRATLSSPLVRPKWVFDPVSRFIARFIFCLAATCSHPSMRSM